MTEFKIDVAFNLSNPNTNDGLYRALKWGVSYKPDGALEYSRATMHRAPNFGQYGYGTTDLVGDEGIGDGDTMTFGVYFTHQDASGPAVISPLMWLRFLFRPAMQIAPATARGSALRTHPFEADKDAAKLLQGIDLRKLEPAPNAESVALGDKTHEVAQFAYGVPDVLTAIGRAPLALWVPPDESITFDYGFAACLAANAGGEPSYYKTDPEIITGKRGGG